MAKLVVTITEIPCPCGRPNCGVVPQIETEYVPEGEPSAGLCILGQVLPKVLASMGTMILNSAREEEQARTPQPTVNDSVEWPRELTVPLISE